MGLGVSRSYMCCSIRDKQGIRDGFLADKPPQFQCVEVDVQLECPVMVAFAPLHQREVSNQRRIALASQYEVHIHRLPDGDFAPGEPPQILLTHSIKMDPGLVVNAILFSDEDNSRNLVVAIGPEAGRHSDDHVVRVWSCEAAPVWPLGDVSRPLLAGAEPAGPTQRPLEWKQSEGFVASLGEHRAPVTRLATNKTYLLTADGAGECRLWQKNRAFQKRGAALLHAGGVTDLAVDRLFAYSAGSEDKRICAWALPDLSPVLAIPVDIPEEMLAGLSPKVEAPPSGPELPAAAAQGAPAQTGRLARLNLLRRPLSRWAGWQGSSRGPKAPRGSLFVAGVLREGCEVAGAGAGVLMEWSLGDKPACQSAQIAHDTPIVALVYGPYDNGPLISADAKGIFRVWEFLLEKGPKFGSSSPRLCFSQQVELVCIGSPNGGLSCPAVAVEQPRGLYVTVGSRRLFVWQRHQDAGSGVSRM